MGEFLGMLLLLRGTVVNENGVRTECTTSVSRKCGDRHELRVGVIDGMLAKMREAICHDKATLCIRVHLKPH